MATKYRYALTNGKTLTLEGDTQPGDDEVEQLAQAQGVQLQPAEPFDVQKQNAIARENMAKQHEGRVAPSPVHEFFRGVEEGTTPEDAGMGRKLLGAVARVGPGRAMRGSEEVGAGDYKKGAHDLIAGGGTTAALMFAPEIAANPVTAGTAMVLGAGGDLVGRKVAEAAGGDEDTQNLAGDIAGLATGAAGSKLGKAIPTAPVLRFVGGEMAKPGGVQGVVGRGLSAVADAGEEASARAHGPIGDLFAPGTADPKVLAATKAAALDKADTLVSKTIEDQHAEANRTNRRLIDEAKARAKAAAAKPAKVPVQSEADRLAAAGVVPTADAAAANASTAAPERARTPYTTPLGSTADETTDPATLALRKLLAERAGDTNPNAQDFPQPAEDVTPRRTNTPTHAQEGEGGRGQEAVTSTGVVEKAPGTAKFAFEWPEVGDQYEITSGPRKGSHVGVDTLKELGIPVPPKTGGVDTASMEVVDDASGPNASGESAASKEALSRAASMKANGEEFVVKKGNTIRKLVGPEAVDYVPQPGETFGIRSKDGSFRPLSQAEIKTGLTASRGKGAMPIAVRRALFNALNKRSE